MMNRQTDEETDEEEDLVEIADDILSDGKFAMRSRPS